MPTTLFPNQNGPTVTTLPSNFNTSSYYANIGVQGSILQNSTVTASSYAYSQPSSGTLQLRGDNADIVINDDFSLVGYVKQNEKMLREIQDRLHILRFNRELEDEWEELRELGNRYRELETQLLSAQKMWDRLQK